MPTPAQQSACVFDAIPGLAAIAVAGEDAERFLNAQLSRDVPAAGAAVAPLAAWHDAKGRVRAVLRVVPTDEAWLLLTHSSVADEVATALRRFVLRASVSVEIAGEVWSGGALLGECDTVLRGAGVELGERPHTLAHRRDLYWLRLGAACIHVIGPPEELLRIRAPLDDAPENTAELAEIRLGLPEVSAELQGQFVPQMLNLDLLGGVSFDKGCYPGQEVIARIRNLGAVKRRMLRFTAASAGTVPRAGSPLLDASGKAVGIVVRAARAERGAELLAVTQLEAARDSLALNGATPAPLERETLPYAIPEIATTPAIE